MHEIRSSIGAEKARTPLARRGGPKSLGGGLSGLTSLAIRREEARLTNQRSEDRLGDQVDRSTIHFRRRKHLVRVVNVSSGGAMIESEIEPRIGETIDVQFADAHRTPCIVRWVREGRIGLEFVDETIVWDCGVPQPVYREQREAGCSREEQSSPRPVVEREERQALLRSGTLYLGGVAIPIRLRNISVQGAKIESEQELRAGSEVELDLGESGFEMAEVRWSKDGHVGLRFAGDFNVGALTPATEEPASEMLKPAYLQTELLPDSPWATRFERLSLDDLKPTDD
jgi:hypothetical protein